MKPAQAAPAPLDQPRQRAAGVDNPSTFAGSRSSKQPLHSGCESVDPVLPDWRSNRRAPLLSDLLGICHATTRNASGRHRMLIIKILSLLAFIGSVAWFIAQRDYEPAIATVTSLMAFIAAWFGDKRLKRQANQNQTVSRSGIGIQACGDVTVGSIRTGAKSTDAE